MKQLKFHSLLFFSIALLLVSGCNVVKINKSSPHNTPTNVSVSYASFPERAYHSATLLKNGNVLLVGGEDNNSPLSRIEIYNPTLNTITQTTSLNFARSSHTATLLENGKVLIVGGYEADSWNPIGSVEIFDPENNSLFVAANLNVTRAYHTATLLSDGKVMVTGGYDVNWDILNSTEIYDPVSNQWTQIVATMAGGRAYHTASILPDGKVLVVAGQDGSDNLATAEIFNPQNNSWTLAQSMGIGRYNHSASTLADGKILVVGGYDNRWNFLNTAEIFNPADGTWSVTANLNTAIAGHTSTLLTNGKVAVIGGRDSNDYQALVQLFDPLSGWSTATSIAHARHVHTATLLTNGKVLVAGGQGNNGSYLDSVELFNPTTNTVSIVAYPAPKILSVATSRSGAKVSGDIIDFKVTFSEQVVISGSPRLALDVGGSIIYATATTTAAAAIHNFRYVVGSSESDNDGIAMNSPLELNGGKILSVATRSPASLNFNTSDISYIAINYAGPTILAVSAPANGVYRAGYYLDFVVTFSEPVTMSHLGGPYIQVDVDGQNLSAYAMRGPASTTRTFRLIVPTGVNDSDGITLFHTIVLNGASLVSSNDGTPIFPSFEVMDTSGITTLDRLPSPIERYYYTENFLVDGRSIVIGGMLYAGNVLTNAVEIYDPIANTWTLMAPMNVARGEHQTLILNDGRILVAGGTNFVASPAYPAFDSVEIFDPVANTWTLVASMNQARFMSDSLVLPDGRVIMVGGRGDSWSFLDSVEIYNPVANTWTTKAPLSGGAQAQHELILLSNGTVYVVGGYNWGVQAPDEIIDPNL